MTPDQQRKILESAAKACGVYLLWHERWGCFYDYNKRHESKDFQEWNPLTNSADTAEMCAKLIIGTEWCAESSRVVCFSRGRHQSSSFADHNNDREAAWRHAATMCAAKTNGYEE